MEKEVTETPKSFREKYLNRKMIGTGVVVACASIGAAVLIKAGVNYGQKCLESCSEAPAEATAFMSL